MSFAHVRLEAFQRRFLAGMRTAPISCFSAPRGAGKTWLSGLVAADALRAAPPGHEIALVAGSVNQGRTCFRFARSFLGEDGYSYLDSAQRCTVTRPDGTKLNVLAASGRTAMGLVRVPLVIADEPAAWRQNDGELLADALITAVGKLDSPLKIVFCGTLAPLGVPGHWWHSMVAGGTRPGYYVQLHQGDGERWDDLRHVYAVNPLARISADLRETLRRERDEARRDSRLKARFLSYRLNLPSPDETTVLLTTDEWKRVLARDVPEREGRPIVGIDLGHSRAWSAGVGLWPSGRIEALAIAPGIPDLRAQEKRDRVPRGTYAKLVEGGALAVAEGLRVPGAARLYSALTAAWGRPGRVLCDYFKLAELRDVVNGAAPIVSRRARWSESTFDIGALRKLAADGPLSCAPGSRALITASLSSAKVKLEEGNMRLVKRDAGNVARDDVAVALVLAAGGLKRDLDRPARGLRWS